MKLWPFSGFLISTNGTTVIILVPHFFTFSCNACLRLRICARVCVCVGDEFVVHFATSSWWSTRFFSSRRFSCPFSYLCACMYVIPTIFKTSYPRVSTKVLFYKRWNAIFPDQADPEWTHRSNIFPVLELLSWYVFRNIFQFVGDVWSVTSLNWIAVALRTNILLLWRVVFNIQWKM